MSDWKPTACILCECNCGVEVQLGGDDGRVLERIRGDRAHPSSRGYLCQKAGTLDHYQNNRDRLLSPMRRRADGDFEPVGWETAIREVADRLQAVRDTHGGTSILYYGGGGQGNHFPGGYATTTRGALGVRYRSNALAQEKTGEFWVSHEMFGAHARGDFEHCDVAVFLGKNPWQSHSIARARAVLKEIARDPERQMIVIDPVRTETAELADIHLAVRPGTDAWLLQALLGVILDERLVDEYWLTEHTIGFDAVRPALERVSIADACQRCGLDEALVRRAARVMAGADRLASFEDLGVQMNRHSTLVSYLHRLLWIVTGSFGKQGSQVVPSHIRALAGGRSARTTPVAGAPIISGLVPCNVIPEEILTDHPDRYRAMIVESANPAHSLADSQKMREALRALEFTVVIDVAMTETAREAEYVLPTATQYEKAEATFFTSELPDNSFHLRHPLFPAPESVLPEAEIHARLAEAMNAMPTELVAGLRDALQAGGRPAFAELFQRAAAERPDMRWLAPALLYRTLGETLPEGLDSAALLWPLAHECAQKYPDSIRRAGIEGKDAFALGEALFEAILTSPSGFVFTRDDHAVSWERLGTPDGKIQAVIPELLVELNRLHSEAPPSRDDGFPFVLAAGERRAFTANTINRNPAWRGRDAEGALRVHPDDLTRLGLDDGGMARLVTRRGTVEVRVESSDRMQVGQLALPNGLGVDYPQDDGTRQQAGAAPNELTAAEHRDPFVGTPWHKSVPARLEALK